MTTMSVAPSSSTTDGMDNELHTFLLKELDVKLPFVNACQVDSSWGNRVTISSRYRWI